MTTTVGRKKQADVWAPFRYNETEKKSVFIVLSEWKQCKLKIAGKNTAKPQG